MTCESWQSKLDPYVDSELSEDDLESLESHLRACPACAAEALGRLQMKRTTQVAGARYSPTPQFRLRVERSIKPKRSPLWAAGWIPKFAATAAVAALVIVFAVLWAHHSQREHALAELADLHVATLASVNPVDVISTDRHTVKPWFTGKLPFTFNLPDLQASPFKLVGGRVAYFEHNPGAQMLFDVGKHQVSVFVFQEEPGRTAFGGGITTTRELAFNVETWSNGGLRYLVISDADRAAVHELSELLRGAGGS